MHSGMDVTAIHVTHEKEEPMTIADRMAILRDGSIIQIGMPDDVFNRPGNMDAAGFIGNPPMNLLPAKPFSDGILVAGCQVADASGCIHSDPDTVLDIRSSHLRRSNDGLPARLLLSWNLGESMLLTVDMEGQIVKLRLPVAQRLAVCSATGASVATMNVCDGALNGSPQHIRQIP